MNVLQEYAFSELHIKNSLFLAEIFPITAQDEARALLKIQKQKYKDASHLVHAFVLGAQGGILGCSDDGEPPGTAGKPALTVLKNSGITNIMLTIMRRFGGTLLGSGGLVKAYTDSAKLVLEKAKTEALIEKIVFVIVCSYSKYEKLKNRFGEFFAEIASIDFKEEVELSGAVPREHRNRFCAFLENASTKGDAVRVLIGR